MNMYLYVENPAEKEQKVKSVQKGTKITVKSVQKGTKITVKTI